MKVLIATAKFTGTVVIVYVGLHLFYQGCSGLLKQLQHNDFSLPEAYILEGNGHGAYRSRLDDRWESISYDRRIHAIERAQRHARNVGTNWVEIP